MLECAGTVMNLTVQQLRDMGYTETSLGQWVRGNNAGPDRVMVSPNPTPPPKRIRQSSKPLLNKLEQRFFDHLCLQHKHLYAQAITFRLANGVRYTPDVFCFDWVWQHETRNVAWEVKGGWFTDDAKVKIKLFAAAYPEILVLLVSDDKATGMWTNQIVYP